jgi:hypothetical protein
MTSCKDPADLPGPAMALQAAFGPHFRHGPASCKLLSIRTEWGRSCSGSASAKIARAAAATAAAQAPATAAVAVAATEALLAASPPTKQLVCVPVNSKHARKQRQRLERLDRPPNTDTGHRAWSRWRRNFASNRLRILDIGLYPVYFLSRCPL